MGVSYRTCEGNRGEQRSCEVVNKPLNEREEGRSLIILEKIRKVL